MQVLGLRKRLEAALNEVEDFLAPHMRKVPLLAPYAEKPHSTRLVYLLAAAPLLAICLPLMLLGGAPPTLAGGASAAACVQQVGSNWVLIALQGAQKRRRSRQ